MHRLHSLRHFAVRHATVLRVGSLVTLFLALWLGAWWSGLLDAIDIEVIRSTVDAYGWAGVALFILAFCIFNLLQLPGMLMIVAAIVAWGPLTGGVIGWVGALAAACSTFMVVRAIGGQALGKIKHPWARRMLEGLERRPIVTMIVLRAVMQAAAPLNATLALTGLRFHRYVLGSAIGLIPPVVVAALFTELFI